MTRKEETHKQKEKERERLYSGEDNNSERKSKEIREFDELAGEGIAERPQKGS